MFPQSSSVASKIKRELKYCKGLLNQNKKVIYVSALDFLQMIGLQNIECSVGGILFNSKPNFSGEIRCHPFYL